MNIRRAVTPWEADYCDMRDALPIPEPRACCDFTGSTACRVPCLEPNRVWDIDFDDGDGTQIDLRYRP